MADDWKQTLKKIYNFIMHDDSIWSWIVNIILAFIIVKFVIYPLLSLILGTSLPLVAVVSGSMEHDNLKFDEWWEENKEWYEQNNITKQEFENFKQKNGFNKGDVIILVGEDDPEIGDTLVYNAGLSQFPIIHRVTYINDDENTYQLKGDNNNGPDTVAVSQDMVLGKATIVVPKLGWLRIWFTEITGL